MDCGDDDGCPLDSDRTVEKEGVSDRWSMSVEYDR